MVHPQGGETPFINNLPYKRDQKGWVRGRAFPGYLGTFIPILSSVLYSQNPEAKKHGEMWGKLRLEVRSKMCGLKVTGRLLVNFGPSEKGFLCTVG